MAGAALKITEHRLLEAARSKPEDLTRVLEDELLYDAVEQLRDGIRMRNKWGQPSRGWGRLFWELLGRVKPPTEIRALIIQQIGADPETARAALASYQETTGIDEDTAAAMAERYLREYLHRRGKRLVVLEDAANAGNGLPGPDLGVGGSQDALDHSRPREGNGSTFPGQRDGAPWSPEEPS